MKRFRTILVLLLTILVFSCEEENKEVFEGVFTPGEMAEAEIVSFSDQTDSAVIVNLSITKEGKGFIRSIGVCWSKNENPTKNNKHIEKRDIGVKQFQIDSLIPRTNYFVRPYVINSTGINYGEQKNFTTKGIPLLNTLYPSAVTGKSFETGGVIEDNGGDSITACGVCWSLLQTPTVELTTKTVLTLNENYFSSNVTGLDSLKNYYVRAYATNAFGTAYGEEFFVGLPVLTTTIVTAVGVTTALSGGHITNDGCSPVIARGVVWSTAQDPVVSLSTKTTEGSGVGNFTSQIADLEPGTTYYVRAYATNGAGTAYGNEVSFMQPITLPVLTTAEVNMITTSSAMSGGNITHDGGSAVIARGVCWGTNSGPTIENSKTSDGTGVGSYVSSITSLFHNTTYYVRAYATNAAGTSYGNEVIFKTDKIETEVVEVLNPTTGKIWMDRNLGASRAATSSTDADAYGDLYQWGRGSDGHEKRSSQTTSTLSSSDSPGHGNFIVSGSDPYDWRSSQNNSLWQGVNGINNPCPEGFRIPSAAEWEAERASWSSNTSAGAFVSSLKLPGAGFRNYSDGSIYGVGSFGYYWSGNVGVMAVVGMRFNGGDAGMYSYFRAYGHSVRCIKDVPITIVLPSVTTTSTTNITSSTVSSGGNITSDGGATVTARGVCWNTSPTPTIDNSKTVDGSGTGSYESNLTGLSDNTTYYVRAYATNSVGTAYGNEVSFTTSSYTVLPTVTTSFVSAISYTSATSGGNVSSDGGATVTSRGVCWSTNPNPTIEHSKTTDGSGTGSFESNLTGLTTYTTYYIRAYATNSAGTSYGEERVFETMISSPVSEVLNPVTGRIWLDRNLGAYRIATSASDTEAYGDLYQWGRGTDGHEKRTSGTTSSYSNSDSPGHSNFIINSDWRVPQNDNLWQGVFGANNPCPNGYKVPTKAEWEAEFNTWTDGAFASPLKLPNAGYRDPQGAVNDSGSTGFYWSATVNESLAYYFVFGNLDASIGNHSRSYGFSVRCIKEDQSLSTPTVTTTSVSSISYSSATSGGNVSSDGGATVTSRGVCWSISPTPTIEHSKTIDGGGTGSFESNLTGLSENTTYYVRAYATNSIGTAYGNEVSFTTTSAPAFSTVTSPTGKVWMDRNLGATRVANSSTDTEGYGDLYQWGRGTDGHEKRTSPTTSTLSSSDTPGHGNFITESGENSDWRSPQNNNLWQGVNGTNNPCPEGFRIPTAAEWNAECASWGSGNSAGAFASPLKLPMAGYRHYTNGSLVNVGSNGFYWSGAVNGTYVQVLVFNSVTADMSNHSHAYGISVRCLKD